MAFQIRRAHRFRPSHQDQIAPCTSNRADREKLPDTLSISHWAIQLGAGSWGGEPGNSKQLIKERAERRIDQIFSAICVVWRQP